jgi:hypothetical protein
LPAEDQNDLGWSSRLTRRNNFYGWNTLNRRTALTIAGTPQGIGEQAHNCPFDVIPVLDAVLSFFFDFPLKWRQKWMQQGPPKKECCVGFNDLVIFLFQTFIQVLPILSRKYESDISQNQDHIFNHPAIVRLKEHQGYIDFAALQLPAYDAAISRSVSPDQASLNSIASGVGTLSRNVEFLLNSTAKGQQETQTLLREILHLMKTKLVLSPSAVPAAAISAQIQPMVSGNTLALSGPSSGEQQPDPINEASLTSLSQTLRMETEIPSLTACTERYFTTPVKDTDLLVGSAALEYMVTLETLNKRGPANEQYGCQELVKAFQLGRMQSDGMTPYPSIEHMDKKFGVKWITDRVVVGPDDTRTRNALRLRSAEYRGIYALILEKIPSNASGTPLENALEQAKLLDCSRPHMLSLSAWWQVIKSNMAQIKKAEAFEKKLSSTDLLCADEKSQVMEHIVSAKKIANMSIQEQVLKRKKREKKDGGRTLIPALTAFKEAEKLYEDLIAAKNPESSRIQGTSLIAVPRMGKPGRGSGGSRQIRSQQQGSAQSVMHAGNVFSLIFVLMLVLLTRNVQVVFKM